MSAAKADYLHEPDYDEPVLPSATSVCPVLRRQCGSDTIADDEVIEEIPVALVYNGISHAVMLASPADLEDFSLGFSLSEGILTHPRELYDFELVRTCDGISLEMEIAPRRFLALKERRRSLAGRTGCGLCGVESLAGVTRMPAESLAPPVWPLTLEAVSASLRQLPACQPLRQKTGAAHAAAWVDAQGNIRCVREDVGRHNALDKLIGAMARQGEASDAGFVLVTSRASYEMVQKVACAGISVLVAVSAPTALAIRQAEAAGILLAGFARAGQLVVYSQLQRSGCPA